MPKQKLKMVWDNDNSNYTCSWFPHPGLTWMRWKDARFDCIGETYCEMCKQDTWDELWVPDSHPSTFWMRIGDCCITVKEDD